MRKLAWPQRRTDAQPETRPGGHGHRGPSVRMLTIRVALAASAIVGIAYVLIAVFVAVVVSTGLTSDVDRHLNQTLDVLVRYVGPGAPPNLDVPVVPGFDPTQQDPRAAPVLLWRVDPQGVAHGQGLNPLDLPAADRSVTTPITTTIDGTDYRIAGRTLGPSRLVVGQSMDGVSRTMSTLIAAEIGIGAALLAFVFLGSVAIGRRVALPIEQARQRQLEFTADASHELRTPLSVIEAQASLALARKRDPVWDGHAFERIDTELQRTRRLVDDMLWLARFDSTARQPAAEPVDLGVLAAQTGDRFGAVAQTRGLHLEVRAGSPETDAIVTAPPEWLDRLVGILLDNACRYSAPDGSIVVGVLGEGRRIRLTVDDSGPGIPEAERGRIFDRFHRATAQPGGAGLGLSIADAIVHATGGRWHIGTSAAGGASIGVSWPRSVTGHRDAHTSGS